MNIRPISPIAVQPVLNYYPSFDNFFGGDNSASSQLPVNNSTVSTAPLTSSFRDQVIRLLLSSGDPITTPGPGVVEITAYRVQHHLPTLGAVYSGIV